jgi:hypothetical protein
MTTTYRVHYPNISLEMASRYVLWMPVICWWITTRGFGCPILLGILAGIQVSPGIPGLETFYSLKAKRGSLGPGDCTVLRPTRNKHFNRKEEKGYLPAVGN